MADEERIKQLNTYCNEWQECLDNAEARRDQLIGWQQSGMSITTSDSEGDIFPTLIQEADNAVRTYQKILIRMQSIRDRAVNGENV